MPGYKMAPSFRLKDSSTTSFRSICEARPVPSQVGHIPPVRSKRRTSFTPLTSMAPWPLVEGTLKEYAAGPPTRGEAMREKSTRSAPVISVAVPKVERELAAIGSCPTMMAAVRPLSSSTSGWAWDCIKPCTKPG